VTEFAMTVIVTGANMINDTCSYLSWEAEVLTAVLLEIQAFYDVTLRCC
jgi:hypothetical protein